MLLLFFFAVLAFYYFRFPSVECIMHYYFTVQEFIGWGGQAIRRSPLPNEARATIIADAVDSHRMRACMCVCAKESTPCALKYQRGTLNLWINRSERIKKQCGKYLKRKRVRAVWKEK